MYNTGLLTFVFLLIYILYMRRVFSMEATNGNGFFKAHYNLIIFLFNSLMLVYKEQYYGRINNCFDCPFRK